VHHVANKCKQQHCKREATTDAFIVKATLPSELSYLVSYWACNPAGVPKPIHKDEFSHLDCLALEPHRGSRHTQGCIHYVLVVHLPNDRTVGGVSGQHKLGFCPSLTTSATTSSPVGHGRTGPIRTTSTPSLVRWLGTYTDVTPDRARDFLKPYAHRCEWDMYYSHTAQTTQTQAQTKRD